MSGVLDLHKADIVFRKHVNIAWRSIADEIVLVPIARSQGDVKSTYVLNDTAARVWLLLDGVRTVAQILEVIKDEYEIEESEAASDLEVLLESLVAYNVLEAVPQ